MLAYPSFALLKKSLPDSRIFALVPEYTQEMAALCPWIDETIIDPGKDSGLNGIRQLIKTIRHLDINVAITLHSTTRIGIALALTRIPYRLAPASKIAQIFYNHKLHQRRSYSEKPEFIYNLDLIKYCLTSQYKVAAADIQPPYLHFDLKETNNLKNQFIRDNNLDKARPIVFVHPGSGGSANNLSLEQYSNLVLAMAKHGNFNTVITAGPGESGQAIELSTRINAIPNSIYNSTEGLTQFARHIQFADLFISGSTGPLHIAGALNTPTAAFYTRRRSATSLRWQTLNSEDKRLAFAPPENTEAEDMNSIDIDDAAKKICCKYFPDSI